MPNPFDSPKRRLARAKQHFEHLIDGGKAFANLKPYRRVMEPNSDGTKDIYKVVLTHFVPDELSDFVTEIAEHLRAALDLAGYAAAVASGKVDPKSAYFPIANSAVELETAVIGRGRCKDLPPDILTLFRGFKPYDGGNLAIWLINRLCNTSKHKEFVSAEIQTEGIDRGFVASTSGETQLPAMFRWDSAKNEMVIGIAPAGAQFHYDLQFSLFIAFGPIEPIEGQPVIPFFDTAIREVERIVLATEAECRRLGLI